MCSEQSVLETHCITPTLLKFVSHYDLSVLSMSVMGFQKKVCMGCVYPWVIGVEKIAKRRQHLAINT